MLVFYWRGYNNTYKGQTPLRRNKKGKILKIIRYGTFTIQKRP